MPWEMLLAFCVCLAGMLALAATLYRVELAGQAARRAPARAAGAARVSTGEKYIAAAYLVVFVARAALRRDHRAEAGAARAGAGGARRELARETSVRRWLSCSSGRRCSRYGEAAVAYAGDARGPGVSARLATWGVRVGWLAQTALLVVQAARADGFPWATWAGSLNLFVWLVVGAYLIWGCRPRYRLLGLAVMPLAALLLVVVVRGGGIGGRRRRDYSTSSSSLHVGLVLAGFAGLHARRRARRPLPLGGAAAQAARADILRLPRCRRSSRSTA